MEMNTVTVYDIQNKFIAYSAPFPAVIAVFCEWGSLYVLAGDRKVCDWTSNFVTLNTGLGAALRCHRVKCYECSSITFIFSLL